MQEMNVKLINEFVDNYMEKLFYFCLKKTGNNGLRFRMSDADNAGFKLKNVRVYNGKVLDPVSVENSNEGTSFTFDFLNDGGEFEGDVTLYGGAYEAFKLKGAKMKGVTLEVDAFGYERLNVEDVPETSEEYRLFMWKDAVPVTAPAIIR